MPNDNTNGSGEQVDLTTWNTTPAEPEPDTNTSNPDGKDTPPEQSGNTTSTVTDSPNTASNSNSHDTDTDTQPHTESATTEDTDNADTSHNAPEVIPDPIAKHHTDQSTTSTTTPVNASVDTINGVNWEYRTVGDDYPVDATYHCNVCNDFHADTIGELREHIRNDEPVYWHEYVERSGLHRCAGCGDALPSLTSVYCDDCTQSRTDRVSCRNCGEKRVSVTDPFCSAECAGEQIAAMDGDANPFSEPSNPDSDWLDHPHRLETGIPSAAPLLNNNMFVCRECYKYGSDDLHGVAVHVAEMHSDIGGWEGYIHRYELRTCRVCGEPLRSLLPYYCSDECQITDPNPIETCTHDNCEAPVERKQTYCSQRCAQTHENN